MALVKRFKENPLISPDTGEKWEDFSTFNASPFKKGDKIHLLYRAVSEKMEREGEKLRVSSIGHAVSEDGIHFKERKQLIKPEKEWEKFGCEDPRVTKIDGKYYIFYTALSKYPFTADGIKVGVAITEDFKSFEKHPVTTFNSKAMALFPEKVNGKYAAVLSVNTDSPPAKNAIAFFDKKEDIINPEYWDNWYKSLHKHTLPLKQGSKHLAEIGAPPIKSEYGWILFYAHILNYHSSKPTVFGIEAVLLDLDDPTQIIGRTDDPLLTPKQDHEIEGNVFNTIFPSGAIKKDDSIYLYYGAADTRVCGAEIPFQDFAKELKRSGERIVWFERYENNPIITPNSDHDWENKATFNPTAIKIEDKIHLLYRAMSEENVSYFGYAVTEDGLHLDKKTEKPVYKPRMEFEKHPKKGTFSGCEDPRAVIIEDDVYVTYTAFNGRNPRVALTTISVEDFKKNNWDKWEEPKLISSPNVTNKDCVIFPEKIDGKYVFLHRPDDKDVWIDFVSDIDSLNGNWLGGHILFEPKRGSWDSEKIGAAAAPIKTDSGWLLLYHGVSATSRYYRVGAVLLDLDDPKKVIARTRDPIFEPRMPYEKKGQVDNVVFPGGLILKDDTLFMYYGGADSVVGVATVSFKKLMKSFSKE